LVVPAALALAIALSAGCKPDLGDPVSLVKEVRILAVKSEPAEAAPGATVRLTALVASPGDSDAAAASISLAVTWSDCTTPKPPSENNFVSATCVTQADDPGKVGRELDDLVPAQACTFFGPVAPPVQPPVRGRDADNTGGFYFPVRASLHGVGPRGEDVTSFGAVRLARSCGLSYADPQTRAQFLAAYALNQNPVLAGLSAVDAANQEIPWAAWDGAHASATVAPGSKVSLRQRWTAESAETFLVYDVAKAAVSQQQEALSASWFVTAGELEHDKTGRSAEEAATAFSDNTWTAPPEASDAFVWLWTVVRDSRGGVSFATYAIRVGTP
jgi:hypothetical protein